MATWTAHTRSSSVRAATSGPFRVDEFVDTVEVDECDADASMLGLMAAADRLTKSNRYERGEIVTDTH